MYHPSMKEKMAGLEDRKRSLAIQVAEAPEPAVLRMHPSLGDLYRQKIGDLVSALSDPGVRVQAAEAMRSLISEIRMVPAADVPDGHRIELSGDLAGILALGEADTRKPSRMARALSETMVAGGRNSRSLRNEGKNAKTSATVSAEVSQLSLVAGARNQRYLRLVEQQIPKLAA